MTNIPQDSAHGAEPLPFSCLAAAVIFAAAWAWYQAAVVPFRVVVGPLHREQIDSVAKPPLLPLFVLVALIPAYALCRSRRPPAQRLVLLILLTVYSWPLAEMLGLKTRVTTLPTVLITKRSESEPVCGLLIGSLSTSARIWYAQFANGYMTAIPRQEISKMRWGPSAELLFLALAAAQESDRTFPDCSTFDGAMNVIALKGRLKIRSSTPQDLSPLLLIPNPTRRRNNYSKFWSPVCAPFSKGACDGSLSALPER